MSRINRSFAGVCRCIAVLSAAILLSTVFGPSASAATFTVTNANDSGAGSLRLAIVTANALAGNDEITFNIPGEGPFTIPVASPLPTLDSTITLDGYTQPGASANTLTDSDNAVIMIRLDGVAAGSTTLGLAVCGNSVTIRGLSITRFQQGLLVGLDATGSSCPTIPSAAVIEGNFIGLAADGTTSAGNRSGGVFIFRGSGTHVGGVALAARNVISANMIGTSTGAGILINGTTSGTAIDGNFIGTDRTGLLDRGNLGAGINVSLSVADAAIGANLSNRIAFNMDGIRVDSVASGIIFFANDIGPNDNLGIDLCASSSPCPDGVTPNDVDDADTGGNDLQNFPVISTATQTASDIQVSGTLDRTSAAGIRGYRIALYASSACDASGNGEGERFLGSFVFLSASPAAQAFSNSVATTIPLPVGSILTTTATDLSTGNTSEFSACTTLDSGSTIAVTNISDSGAGSLRTAISQANVAPSSVTIIFNIPGIGPFMISPISPLPTLVARMTIDGYTQPGASPNTLAEGDDAVIKIRLDGAGAGSNARGLAICGDAVTVRGLSITQFVQDAIDVGANSSGSPCGAAPNGVVIEGNFIGLAADGTTGAGNILNGVLVSKGSSTRIGGATPAARNVISATLGGAVGAVVLVNSATTDTTIDGNFIGTDRTGNLDRGNLTSGIVIGPIIPDAAIGAKLPNRIAFNTEGIRVFNTASGVAVFANDIGPNDNLGIDLCALSSPCPDGVTANDLNDTDTGGNNLQNFPVLAAAEQIGASMHISGILDVPVAVPTQPYTLAFYASAACDSSGNGEGSLYLGSVLRNFTNATQSFNVDLVASAPVGSAITSTATFNNSTSEFSNCVVLSNDQVFANGFE
ncbi:MAG: hypothetical protein ABI451_07860 [Dokdonella sp.]